MEDILKCEETLLSLLDNDFTTSGGNVDFIEEVKNGRFLKLLESTKCQQIFNSYLEEYRTDFPVEELLEKSVNTYMENDALGPNQQLEVLSMGVASLYAFIQSNWTGPSLVTSSAKCVFPWLQSWIESSESEKDVQMIVTECLILDGEACNPNMTCPELLLIARLAIHATCSVLQPLASCKWWLLRCLFIHQQVLDEFSPKLHTEMTKIIEDMEKCEPLLTKEHNLVCFYLEAMRIQFYYRYVTQSYEFMKMATKASNMTVDLMGALGLRTKFQVKELPQLTLKVSVSENRPLTFPTVELEHLPKDLKLDDEVRLDKIKFTIDSDGKFPDMHPIEQAVVLGIFHQTLTSQPKDALSNEELLPYLTCILFQPLCWSLQMSSLLERSNIEKDHSRSVERAMMQTEELVHCFSREKPDIRSRLLYIFNSYLPPRWIVEARHAHQLVSLGLVKSALDIYLRLQMWDRVIACYNVLNMKHKASEIIKQELNKKETVKLWCLLGDATDDPECYEKAWELSEHRSGQAQRHWGLHFFNKRKYAESIPHLRESLNINSLQVSLWFRLGFAALDQEDWNLCVTAYQRYCSLDPESFEAWNNLSKAYVKLNQKFRAWKTLQEALKWDYENWKLWDNYMVVSVDLSEFNEVMKAYNRILDLKPKHVDIEVLRILVEALTSKYQDPQLIQQAEKLFIRLTQEVRGNHLIWQQHAKLILIHSSNKESFETMEKSITSLQRGFWCADEDFNRGLKECFLTMQLTSQLATATLECCEKSPTPQRAVHLLTYSKLCLQSVIARVKKFYQHILSNDSEPDQLEICSSLQDLESKLSDIIAEIQQRKSST